MKNKKIVLGVQIFAVALLVIGVTYAAIYTMSQMDADITTANMEVNFQGDTTFSSNTLAPIKDADSALKALSYSFSVKGSESNNVEIGYRVVLSDLVISDELKIPEMKWELLKAGTSYKTGTFENLGSSTKLVLFEEALTLPKATENADEYTLRLWISDNGEDQNSLMGKSIKGKITVELIKLNE